MKKGTKVFLIILTVVLVLGGLVANYGVKTSNGEKSMRNAIPAQTDAVDLFYTKLWETLKTNAGIVKENVTNQKEFAIGIMEGRYSTGEKSMMWIQEQNPNFDASGYDKLMNTVEGLREGFYIEQKKLRDMKLTHDNMIDLFPSSLFVGDRGKIDVQLLINKETKTARATGIDEGPELF